MNNNLPEWNEERVKLIFEAIPEAKFVACDAAGHAKWFERKPQIEADNFWLNGTFGYIGKFHCPDWTKSLYGRRWVPKKNERLYIVNLFVKDGFGKHIWRGTNSR